MIGVFFLSILTELVTLGQRSLYQKLEPGQSRHLIMSSLYAFQVLLGFLLMLVVMSYSIELIFSVVVGLAAGYVMLVDDASGKPKSFDGCHRSHEKASSSVSHLSDDLELKESKV